MSTPYEWRYRSPQSPFEDTTLEDDRGLTYRSPVPPTGGAGDPYFDSPTLDPAFYEDQGFSRRSPGNPDTPGAGWGEYFGVKGFGQEVSDQLLGYSGFDDLRAQLLNDIVGERNAINAEFDRRKGSVGGGAAIARLNREIAEKKEELGEANKQYRLFMDTIAPGFSDAVEKAEKAAAATAAIDATFDQSQKQIDAAYSSASGRVRAIADKVAGSGSVEVANALNESIYEMKDIIDRSNELNREQTLVLHRTAAGLAAAAAESEHAGLRGTTAREQFVTQAKYEKIITNLIRQRNAASAARARAMRSIEEAREAWKAGFEQDALDRLKGVDGLEASFLSASASPEGFRNAGVQLFFDKMNADPATAIERTFYEPVQFVIEAMDRSGQTDFGAFIAQNWDGVNGVPREDGYLRAFGQPELDAILRYEDQIETGVLHLREVQRYYNEEFTGRATNPATQFMQDFDMAQRLGLNFGESEDFGLRQNASALGFGSDLYTDPRVLNAFFGRQ